MRVRTGGASRAFGRGSSALVLGFVVACAATPDAPPREKPIAYVEGDTTKQVERALAPAVAVLAQRNLVVVHAPLIVVHASADEFMAATGQRDPALRAWTTFQTIHLMPLSSWSRHDDEGVQERMAHELCHVALYQRFGSEARAKEARIPRFFDEGVCSVVAGQERVALETIAFVAPPMPFEIGFFRADPEVAYAAAHHAIAFLDRKLEHAWLDDVLAKATHDENPEGSIERALLSVTGYDPVSLWRAVVDSLARPA